MKPTITIQNTTTETNPPHITRWMTISDPSIEQKFQNAQIEKWRMPIFSTLSILLLINLFMFIADYYYEHDAANQDWLILLRIALLTTILSFFIIFLYNKNQSNTLTYLKLFIGIYLTFILIFIFSREHLGFIEPVAQIVIIFILYAITPLSWLTQISYAMTWSIVGMIGWYFKIGIDWAFYSILSWQFVAHIMGALIARNLHFFARSFYIDQLTLSQQIIIEQTLRSQLSDLIDLLTHELRNPLANIEAQARLIERTHDYALIHGMTQKIIYSTHISAEIISTWVDKAWQNQQPAQTISADTSDQFLISLLHQIYDNLSVRYPNFYIAVAEQHLPIVNIELKILRLVFTNILENAAKYAPSERPLRINFREKRGKLIIRFRDYGQGISIDDQLLIFSKYYRTNPQQQTGYGVGLYLVREMLEQCHASIRVQSRMGYGTAFIVELPVMLYP